MKTLREYIDTLNEVDPRIGRWNDTPNIRAGRAQYQKSMPTAPVYDSPIPLSATSAGQKPPSFPQGRAQPTEPLQLGDKVDPIGAALSATPTAQGTASSTPQAGTGSITATTTPAAATGKPEVANLPKTSNFSWKDIYDLNKSTIGNNPNLIKTGQVLKLPNGQSYTVKSGDNLTKIAKSQAGTGTATAPTPGSGAQKSATISPQVKANREAGKPDWYEPEDYARDEKIQGLLHPEKNQTAYQKGVAKEKDQLAQMAKNAGVTLPNMSTNAGPQRASAPAQKTYGDPDKIDSWDDINADYKNWRPSKDDIARARALAKELETSGTGGFEDRDAIERELYKNRPAEIPISTGAGIDNLDKAYKAWIDSPAGQAEKNRQVRENLELDRIKTLINHKNNHN